jgi:hypothetical protein
VPLDTVTWYSHASVPVSSLHICAEARNVEYVLSVGCLSRRKACVTALTVLKKLSDRDWHLLLRCIEVSQSFVIRIQLNVSMSKYVRPCCYSTVTPNVSMSKYVRPCCYSTVTPNVMSKYVRTCCYSTMTPNVSMSKYVRSCCYSTVTPMSKYVRPCCYSTVTPNVSMLKYVRPCCYSTVTPRSLPAVQPHTFPPFL